ncbi:MAG: hypothetical protein UR60_C0036G0015 [Candidatus Moranbacteria bacterium GW2011_GWF2_34_56]|nr:MAG: hypothetical protein UR51_C0009G0110 [Candidatus Moranbacteria bacterium GW2011_GWF1_34_10]KKP63882.1 MAG: hypothetical protein UR60_C0036G0015 [Candidatus Moranbacteria bacterium GW2011_GWF2_34_56]
MNKNELLSKEPNFFSLSSMPAIVGFKAVEESRYPFYIPNFFLGYTRKSEEERRSDFESTLKTFIAKYLTEWFKYMRIEKGGVKDEDDFLLKLSAISDDISKSNIFSAVVSKKNIATFNVPANKSVFNITKIGDCLGIKLESEHKGGMAAIESMRTDMDTIFRPQLFMESISSWIPLSGRRESNSNDEIVDFSHMIDQLRISLPSAIINGKGEVADGIVGAYKESGRKEFCVGDYCGVPIYARITHGENLDKTNIRSTNYYSNDVRIWRTGNVQNLQGLEYRFKDSQDLALVLSVRNSLPSWSSIDSIEDNFKNHEEQWRMKAVAAMINTQLQCMLMRPYINSQKKQK